jgi:membrane associated rhomboid family serine protease
MSANWPADDDRDKEPGSERPGYEPLFTLPGVVVVLIAACVLVHLVRLYALDNDQDVNFILRTAFIPVRYLGPPDLYSFTSPVTYAFLHGSIAHLAVNMIWLAAFGSPLAHRLGPWRFVIFWIFTGLAAVLLHDLLHPTDTAPLVGASGAISGMMGAAARFGFRIDRTSEKPAFEGPLLSVADTFRSRAVITFLAVWMIVNLVTGLIAITPGVDDTIAWEAHIGGFLAGFLCIGLFDRRRGQEA